MVGLCFHNERDRFLANYYSAWDAMASAWGIDGVLIVDEAGEFITRFPTHPKAYSRLSDVIIAFPDHKFVYLFLESSVPGGFPRYLLHNYRHPRSNVIYVVGHNWNNINLEDLSTQNGSEVLSIECPTAAGADHALWAFDCGLVVAYDRYLKSKLGI